MSDIYSRLSAINEQPVAEMALWLANVQEDVAQYDIIQQSLLANIGEITFGTPIAYPAEEEGITVPSSLTQKFDVYWTRLNVSFRGMNPKDLVEMGSTMRCQKGV